MNAAQAIAGLQDLRRPVVATRDAAALWGLSVDAANKALRRLAGAGLVTPLRHGLWIVGKEVDPYLLADYLTAPYPSYVSLQSALYLHGLISQIPHAIYLASLDRTQRIRTAVGTFSVHRIAPEIFGGFDLSSSGVKLATPEKAVVDFFYLSGTRSRLFAALPEIELPSTFRFAEARTWMDRIPSRRLRTVVATKLGDLAAKARSRRKTG
ncbi:MAG TPA: hypothetical protein VHO06_12045 [Polyangia bacterium]|nr:hypothetical protein [Polyangia bacterium]